MADQNITRIKCLKLWELLCRETDAEHPLSSVEIIRKLAEEGISFTRKTLYRDIEVLNHFGYEIFCTRSRANEYYVTDRNFDMAELHILMDALQAASFISAKKTAELSGKVAALAGSKTAETMKRNMVAFRTVKTNEETVLYSVNEILTALLTHKKISFLYFHYGLRHEKNYIRDKRPLIVSPLFTVFSNDQYYLLFYDSEYGEIVHYRIDKMENVLVLEEEAEDPPEEFRFSPAQYKKSVFDMYSGKEETVRFSVDPVALDVVFDKFGAKTALQPQEDGRVEFSARVQVGATFFGWCATLGSQLKILAPAHTVAEWKQHVDEMMQQYREDTDDGSKQTV